MTTTDSPLQHQAQDAEGLREALLQERAELQAAHDAAPGWGAAVGARAERIREIDRALSASPPQAETPGLDREAVARIIDPDAEWEYLYNLQRQRDLGRSEINAADAANVCKPKWSVALAKADAILAAAETPGLDREAVARLADSYVQRVCEWDDRSSPEYFPEALLITGQELEELLIEFAGDLSSAILAATAVSQPPTTRHGAEDVEALRAWAVEKIERDRQLAIKLKNEAGEGTEGWGRWDLVTVILRDLAQVFRTHALPAQLGPAPVGEGDAIEALRRIIDNCARSDLTAETALVGISMIATKALAALDSIPAVGGAEIPEGWRLVPVEPTPAMLCAYLGSGRDAFRLLVQAIYCCMVAAAPLPAAPTQTAREGGE